MAGGSIYSPTVMTQKAALSPRHKHGAQPGNARRATTRARIVAAAFKQFGQENGLYARIDDIARDAGVTRATFYNHFGGMAELREAISYELTHDFLTSVNRTTSRTEDPRQRASSAIRFFLRRARNDSHWARSIINISANGIIFGAETFRQAEQTIIEGMEAGQLRIRNSALGRDLVLGACLAAMSSMLRQGTPDDYPELIAGHVLTGLGVPFATAQDIANRPLPELLSGD